METCQGALRIIGARASMETRVSCWAHIVAKVLLAGYAPCCSDFRLSMTSSLLHAELREAEYNLRDCDFPELLTWSDGRNCCYYFVNSRSRKVIEKLPHFIVSRITKQARRATASLQEVLSFRHCLASTTR